MKKVTLSLMCLALLLGCAKDPSKGVPKAKVVSAPAAEKKSDDKAEKKADDKAGEKAVESPKESPAVKPVTIELTGKIRFTGSKVTGSHSCVLSKSGGSITLNGDDLAQATFRFEAQTGALRCDEGNRNDWTPKLEGHLAGKDFFWSEKHPKAIFASTAIVAWKGGGATHQVTGNLTLRGVTKSITIPATIKLAGKAVSGTTEFSINRKDFGIEYAGKADDLIRDNVVLTVELNGGR
jgi:polyisoprenoid-binding protein YceI